MKGAAPFDAGNVLDALQWWWDMAGRRHIQGEIRDIGPLRMVCCGARAGAGWIKAKPPQGAASDATYKDRMMYVLMLEASLCKNLASALREKAT